MADNDFSRLEIMLDRDKKFFTVDPVGQGLLKRAQEYFGIVADDVKHIRVFTVDQDMDQEARTGFQEAIVDPVTQVSSYTPLVAEDDMDFVLHVAKKPGVRDNPGAVAADMANHIIGDGSNANVYSSDYFAIKGADLTREDIEKLGSELMANHIVERFEVYSKDEWDPEIGIGRNTPVIDSDHVPQASFIPITGMTIDKIKKMSDDHSWALQKQDIGVIKDYFSREDVIARRKMLGLDNVTDIEMEAIAQGRSDHCNHNTFNAIFNYTDNEIEQTTVIPNLFKKYIQIPTEELAASMPGDVVSVLEDNSGVRRFNERFFYVATSETHNSPSNMEAYGGAITGIVGVYRDPMGTGKGSKLIMGAYGFCVGPRDYDGPLRPALHPRRLQDGVIEGVKDGGNKSGIPTPIGFYNEEFENMAKSNIFVTAIGLQEEDTVHKPAYEKEISPGDLIVMSGGRVGKDGIHGVTAASEQLTSSTPAQHVQIGDPFTQKKMHDFLNEARDLGYVKFITDNGGGGLSSSVGESARFENTDGHTGAEVDLDKVPLKYAGLDQWEIWVSESQERMTIAVNPSCIDDFMELSDKHNVESTAIGKFNNSEALHIKYDGKTCAYIETELLEQAFPQWEFDAVWESAEARGLREPNESKLINKIIVKHDSRNAKELYSAELREFLKRPNIASKEWIARQYDHEVQGTSALKPFVGVERDVPADAIIIRPDLDSEKGFVFTQGVKQKYSKIDAYHMTTAVMDKGIRSALVVGGTGEHLSGMDNYCWPTIQPAENNPDATHKAAQLIRSCKALKEVSELYKAPLLSGKDSMYIDQNMPNSETGEKERLSGLETLQYTCMSTIDDVADQRTPDAKEAGNLIYVIGMTRDELGGSEYYDMHGFVGANVPQTDNTRNKDTYEQFEWAREYAASAKAVDDLATGLFQMAAGGRLGIDVDLGKLHTDESISGHLFVKDTKALYSESTGRILVEVRPEDAENFEQIMGNRAACIGGFTDDQQYRVKGFNGDYILDEKMDDLITDWKSTHGDR